MGRFEKRVPRVLLDFGSVPSVENDEFGHNLLSELHLTLSGYNSQSFLG